MAKSKSKKDILREAVSQPPRKLTQEEREDLGKKLLGPQSPVKKVLVSLETQDLEWLDMTVASLKRTRRRSNKSELIKLGIAAIKGKSPEELRELLRDLD